ncbi:PIN domain-containing protein [Natronomonas sp. CBA1123]|uniref:type II toxin-antitoxin system VapC family toxin n=1 Tax=Natronomonas sp. CBA1123 TaxID=2668070 RepID=UPI0012EAC25F|nr:type II toxin-antitoxin system VapC family toxin [Natronomonas sp. CBA1123]MUV85156.1 PIN domain-containing protein [Natronomonas sp. CBA1123]
MTVLIDTGVVYADHDTDATRHEAASRALDAVYDGEFGHPYLTDYIFDEAITLTRKRTGSYCAAKQLSDRLLGEGQYPSVYEILHVSKAGFGDAVDIFERYDDQALSFTDATIVAVAERFDIDQVLSFDAHFDGVVPRVDPGDI